MNFRPNRRKILSYLGLFSGAIASTSLFRIFASPHTASTGSIADAYPDVFPVAHAANVNPHRVVLVKTTDRAAGTQQAIDLLQPSSFSGKRVFIKPNYNTGDPAPAATDPAVLEALIQTAQRDRARQIQIGDRSGMADTRAAMQQKQAFKLADQYGLEAMVFDELGRDNWRYFPAEGTNWSKGFAVARPVLDADAIVNTCCLKTHRFGGHFTLSLKNTVGMVAKYVPGDPHNYMTELHRSANQRYMIAEINRTYRPSLVLLDGVEAFVNGGPASGQVARPGVILASTDRIAIDAVGIALLRSLGTTPQVAQGSIWQLDQIRRAADLGLGAINADQIDIITADAAGQQMADQIRQYL
jgi:uncharacterized protein (DUF362 family)